METTARAVVAPLASRAVIALDGADAAPLLDRLITADTDAATADTAAYAALLTPQGKVLADFLVMRTATGFLLDAPAAAAAELLKRFTLYKLRAAVTVRDATAETSVWAAWGMDTAPPGFVRDPRVPGLGFRAMLAAGARPDGALRSAGEADWQAHRTRLCVPEAGTDFALGDAFPHDIALDQLSGVDFAKGCYVGQEVVSRMEHRATARRRPVAIAGAADLPPTGTEILAAGRPAGLLGSVDGTAGVAILRLDRVAAAVADGAPLLAGAVPVTARLPDWARYGWPPAGDDPA